MYMIFIVIHGTLCPFSHIKAHAPTRAHKNKEARLTHVRTRPCLSPPLPLSRPHSLSLPRSLPLSLSLSFSLSLSLPPSLPLPLSHACACCVPSDQS